MKQLQKNKTLYFLLILVFVCRLLLLFIFKPWLPEIQDKVVLLYDAVGYHKLALILLETFRIKNEILRTPIYPAFIAVFYALFGVKPFIVLFAQIFISVATGYFFYKIIAQLSNRMIANIALFIFAIEPTLILYTTFLYSEVLFMFFTMFSLYLIIGGLKQNKILYFILAGISLGLATLTRPAGQYLIIVYVLLVIFYTLKNNSSKLKFAVLLTVFYLLSIFPWAMRNYIYYGRFKLSNTMDHNALILSSFYTEFQNSKLPRDTIIQHFLYQLKAAAPTNLKDSMPSNFAELNRRQSFENTDIFAKVAKNYLLSHKKEFILAQIQGAINLHVNMGTEQYMLRLHQETKRWDIKDKVGLGLFAAAKKFFATKTTTEITLGIFILSLLVIVYGYTLVGIGYTIKNKDFYILIFCILNIGYYVSLSSIYPTPRFRNPFMPFYIFLAAYGIYNLHQKLFGRNNINVNNR